MIGVELTETTVALNGAPRDGQKAAALPLFCHCRSLSKLCRPLSLHVLSYPSTGGSKIFSSSRCPAMLSGYLSCCPACGGRVDRLPNTLPGLHKWSLGSTAESRVLRDIFVFETWMHVPKRASETCWSPKPVPLLHLLLPQHPAGPFPRFKS